MPVPRDVRATLDALPDDALVLDVGGWASSDPRADWVIDVGSWTSRGYYTRLGDGDHTDSRRVTEATWVERDICDPAPWPFEDGMFAYVICSHTLEDLRDPVRVCHEIARVGRAGYIETPGAAIELTRGIESPLWCGWHHHRWLVTPHDAALSFLFKPHHVHSRFWPAVPTPRLLRSEAAAHMQFRWEGGFAAYEHLLVDFDELDAHLRGVARAAAVRASRRAAIRHTEQAGWTAYRAARARAGACARRLGRR